MKMQKSSRYFAFYKPYRVLCQFSPEQGKETLADYLSLPKDVYPVGRLDYDSEGLLLLTNDNAFKSAMLEPDKAHKKIYLVQVDGAINEEAANMLRKGVIMKHNGMDYKTKPALVRILTEEPSLPPREPPIRFRKNIPVSWLEITITEGKNRQVRKMTAAVGFPALRLVRVAVGKFLLEGMAPGELKEIFL